MDKTTLTLAVDSTQVGTAASAFERLVATGNAAATTAGKVTSATLAQGRAFSQNLVPALNRGAAGVRTVTETQRALGQDAARQLAQGNASTLARAQVAGPVRPSFAAGASPAIQSPTTGRVAPVASPVTTTSIGQVPAAAAGAQAAIDRLTTSARASRTAFMDLAPTADATVRSFRQLNATPIRISTPQGLSQVASVLQAAQRVNPSGLQGAAAVFGSIAEQAARAAAAAAQANRVITAVPRVTMTGSGAPVRAPLVAPQIVSAATGQRAPIATGGSVSQLAGEAGRAQSAIDRLTSAARTQRGVLAQLTPAASATAGAYRQLSSSPVNLPAPAGLSAAAAALRAAAEQARDTRRAITDLNRTPVRIPALPRVAPTPAGGPAPARPVPPPAPSPTPGGPRPAPSAQPGPNQLTPNQRQQLSFQLNDFFVQIASGGSALTAFIQQGSQLSGTFGGAAPAFRALLSLITPTVGLFGGAAVAVGGFALALSKAESAARSLNAVQALLAGTGRQGMFNDDELRTYILRLSELPGLTRETATAIISELSKVHEVGGALFKDLAEVSVAYAKATGKEAPDAAKELARAFADPQKGAATLEASLGTLSSSTVLTVARLSRLGDVAGAQRALMQGLQSSVKDVAVNAMTPLERSVDKLGSAWDRAMASLGESSGLRTVNALLAKTVNAVTFLVDNADKLGQLATSALPAPVKVAAKIFGSLVPDEKPSKQKASGNIKTAAGTPVSAGPTGPASSAADAEIKRSLDAAKSYQGQATKVKELTETRKRFNAALAQSVALYGKNSEQANVFRGAIDNVNDQIAAIGKQKVSGEGSQILRAQLQNDLKGINDVFEKQRDAYQFQNAFVEASYRNGTLSIGTLMQQRREVIEGTAQAEIDSLDKERARLQQGIKQNKDPSERIQMQTRINEIDVERDRVETKREQDVTLLNQEEIASYRALGDQITEYRANLLQLAGDEAGAAALRAQTAITNAKVLSAQSGGQISEADVAALGRLTAAQDAFNEVQRQTSLLASNSARAEESFAMASEQSGMSLLETERGIYQLRTEELKQLGNLAQKAKELADASTDPRIKAFAADLALEYAKAADAIDPALNRLRDARRELAAGLANTAGQAPSAFIEEYSKRRQGAADDIKRQKDEYSRKIDMLEGYLATTQDKTDKARLRERIKAEEAKRDGVKGESKGSSVFKAINDAVLQPMAEQVFNTVNKLLITDPLQKYLEGQLKGLTEGGGMLAGFFKDALGIQADPKQLAQQQQTAAITASSTALDVLTAAAQGAANALASRSPAGAALAKAGQPPTADDGADPIQPAEVSPELADAQKDATASALDFGKQAATATSDIARLASAAGVGGNAMAQLPSIINLFQSAVAAMGASGSSSGGGGIIGGIASLFSSSGSGGGVASAGDYASFDYLAAATGGYISGPGTGTSDSIPAKLSNGEYVMPAAQTKLFRPVLEQMRKGSIFEKVPKYHTGGIVGKTADKVAGKLAKDEVAAVLMGGPKGKREEVLHASDPRHRDNLGMSIVARIMAESKHEGLRVKGARELGGPVSSNSMYRVNEKGPELLQVAGKQYLMTGSQGGNVVPHDGGGKGSTTVLHVNVTPPVGGSAASAQQWGAMAGRQIQRATRRNT